MAARILEADVYNDQGMWESLQRHFIVSGPDRLKARDAQPGTVLGSQIKLRLEMGTWDIQLAPGLVPIGGNAEPMDFSNLESRIGRAEILSISRGNPDSPGLSVGRYDGRIFSATFDSSPPIQVPNVANLHDHVLSHLMNVTDIPTPRIRLSVTSASEVLWFAIDMMITVKPFFIEGLPGNPVPPPPRDYIARDTLFFDKAKDVTPTSITVWVGNSFNLSWFKVTSVE